MWCMLVYALAVAGCARVWCRGCPAQQQGGVSEVQGDGGSWGWSICEVQRLSVTHGGLGDGLDNDAADQQQRRQRRLLCWWQCQGVRGRRQ